MSKDQKKSISGFQKERRKEKRVKRAYHDCTSYGHKSAKLEIGLQQPNRNMNMINGWKKEKEKMRLKKSISVMGFFNDKK